MSERYTLFDRIAVAFGAALTAFILGSIFWGITLKLCRAGGMNAEGVCIYVPSFSLVFWFAAGFAAVGFIFGPERTADMLTSIWSRRKDDA